MKRQMAIGTKSQGQTLGINLVAMTTRNREKLTEVYWLNREIDRGLSPDNGNIISYTFN